MERSAYATGRASVQGAPAAASAPDSDEPFCDCEHAQFSGDHEHAPACAITKWRAARKRAPDSDEVASSMRKIVYETIRYKVCAIGTTQDRSGEWIRYDDYKVNVGVAIDLLLRERDAADMIAEEREAWKARFVKSMHDNQKWHADAEAEWMAERDCLILDYQKAYAAQEQAEAQVTALGAELAAARECIKAADAMYEQWVNGTSCPAEFEASRDAFRAARAIAKD
jgi:hypothetical protein